MRALAPVVLLAALPALAGETVEGAVSAEITVGKSFALNANGEFSPILDRLWLVFGYGLLKSPDIPATDTVPKVTTSASHVFSGGVDVSPHRVITFSLLAQGSPRAYESVPLNPGSLLINRITLSTSRRSAGGSFSVIIDSAGDSAFEWGVDAGINFNWNELGIALSRGAFIRLREEELLRADLFVTRPQLGLSARLADRVTLSPRAGYTFYSDDPLTVGRLNPDDVPEIERAVLSKLADNTVLAQAAASAVASRLSTFDALSGYPYGPVRFDLKAAVTVKIAQPVRLQLSWTYLRYVPTQGFGNVVALKASFHFGSGWKAWLIGGAQLDATVDYPSTRADWQGSGHLSVGGEFAF